MFQQASLTAFWRHVDRSGGPDACHPWGGPKIRHYGRINMTTLDGKIRGYKAHRVIMLLAEWPDADEPKKRSTWTCGDRLCCNITHMLLVDRDDLIRSPRERFEEKVDRSGGPDACHLWMGFRGEPPRNYGRFGLINDHDKGWHTEAAHRVAWELEVGPIPEGMKILHACDNPPCVNVRHLSVGTQADNIADMYAKGRNRVNPDRKLTSADREAIRAEYQTRPRPRQSDIAAKYGVKQGTVSHVLRTDPDRPPPPLKITDADRIAICAEYAEKRTTMSEIARRYGVAQNYISAVIAAGPNRQLKRKRRPTG